MSVNKENQSRTSPPVAPSKVAAGVGKGNAATTTPTTTKQPSIVERADMTKKGAKGNASVEEQSTAKFAATAPSSQNSVSTMTSAGSDLAGNNAKSGTGTSTNTSPEEECGKSAAATARQMTTATTTTTTGGVTKGVVDCPSEIAAVPEDKLLADDQKMGATLIDTKRGVCSFRVWGPHIDECWVEVQQQKGEEKDANAGTTTQRFPMKKEGDSSTFATQLEGVRDATGYHFVMTSNWNDCYQHEGHELHRRDPYARHTDFNSNTCFVVDPRFEWTAFEAPKWNKLIIYEMHAGTFAKKDNKSQFAAVTERLPYIKQQGYTAIEIMPPVEFGGLWGYNPRVLMSPHGPFGTPHELKVLVDSAHKEGLSVIFDLVLNHGSVRNNSLWNFDGYGPNGNGGIYFEGQADSGWGTTFALHKREVREMVKEAAMTFVTDYHADGLRLDAVHHMPWDFLKELTAHIKSKSPKCILIAEITPETPKVIEEAGFDSCWIHASYYDAIKVMRGEDSDNQMGMLRAMINGHRGFKETFNSVNSVLGSHDQCGNRDPHGHSHDNRVGRYLVDQLGGRDNWHARAQCRMWLALQAFSRPIPMTFMGTESLQTGWWHVDRFFDWDNAENNPNAKEMLALTRDVNAMRRSHDCYTEGSSSVDFCHEDHHNRVLAFSRHDSFVVVNAGENQWDSRDYGVVTSWKSTVVDQVFNSQAAKYGGWDGSWTNIPLSSETATTTPSSADPLSVAEDGKLFVTLPKWSVTVYRRRE